MSFDHKAYIFDWETFEKECAPKLSEAFKTENISIIEEFIQMNIRYIKSPYDGESISSDWKSHLENGGIQELTDYAITKYYDLETDFGLSGDWMNIEENLNSMQASALLGVPFSVNGITFDPGLQGSYFQPPNIVQQSISSLASNNEPALAEFCKCLQGAASKGVYVTF